MGNDPGVRTFETTRQGEKGEIGEHYRWQNDVPLDDNVSAVRVNVLDFHETLPGRADRAFSWVTDLHIDESSVNRVMRAARAQWRLESDIMKMLKIPDFAERFGPDFDPWWEFELMREIGYDFECNLGHGDLNPSCVHACLALLAFLIDPVQEQSCPLFRFATDRYPRKWWMRNGMQSTFHSVDRDTWDFFWRVVSRQFGPGDVNLDDLFPEQSS